MINHSIHNEHEDQIFLDFCWWKTGNIFKGFTGSVDKSMIQVLELELLLLLMSGLSSLSSQPPSPPKNIYVYIHISACNEAPVEAQKREATSQM